MIYQKILLLKRIALKIKEVRWVIRWEIHQEPIRGGDVKTTVCMFDHYYGYGLPLWGCGIRRHR